MRIGVLSNELNYLLGGGASFEDSILKTLVKTESTHEFFIFYKGNQQFENIKNINFINLFDLHEDGKSDFPPPYNSLLNKACLDYKIDLMYFPSPRGIRAVKVPYIITVWDLQHRLQPYFPEVSFNGWTFEEREIFYQKYLPKASYILIGNQVGKNQIMNFYNIPDFRIKTIPLPVDDSFFESHADIDIKQKFNIKNEYIFYPAQFWPHKNHIRLLKALKILNSQGEKYSLVLTGSDQGNLDYINKKTVEMNLQEQVYNLGFVEKEDMISLYKNAACLVFPSFFGPDNIPPLESMALGCPVISSNSEGMQEQLGDAALFFNPCDENEIVECVKKLQNNEIRTHLVQKGYDLAIQRTSSIYITKLFKIIDDFKSIKECWE